MDSVSLTVGLTHSVSLANDNGSQLPDTTFRYLRERSAGYGTVGTSDGQIDVLHYKEYTLDKSGSVTISLAASLENPVDAGAGNAGAMAELCLFHAEQITNPDGSTAASGFRVGDASGAGMAKLMFGDVSATLDVHSNAARLGHFSWYSDPGVAVGGDSVKITNLDSSDTITFLLLMAGRSS